MGNDVVAAVTFTVRTIDAWMEMTNLKNHDHRVLTENLNRAGKCSKNESPYLNLPFQINSRILPSITLQIAKPFP